jgi:hypothetical protein
MTNTVKNNWNNKGLGQCALQKNIAKLTCEGHRPDWKKLWVQKIGTKAERIWPDCIVRLPIKGEILMLKWS